MRSCVLFLARDDVNVDGMDREGLDDDADLEPLNPRLDAFASGVSSGSLARQAASQIKLLHEEGHWVRHHASTIGYWLNQVRAARDCLGVHGLLRMSPSARGQAARQRSSGTPLVSLGESHGASFFDASMTLPTLRSLRLAEQIVSRGTLDVDPRDWWQHVDLSLEHVASEQGRRSAGGVGLVEGFQRASADVVRPTEITTTLIGEAASTLDEIQLLDAGYDKLVGDGLAASVRTKLKGVYGPPIQLIKSLNVGDRSVLPVCQALFDFALNPPVPGLDGRVRQVSWVDFYPPYRLIRLVELLGRRAQPLVLPREPCADDAIEFRQRVEQATGLIYGRVDEPSPRLRTSLFSVPDAVRRFHEVALGEPAARLQAFGETRPHLVTNVATLAHRHGPEFFSQEHWKRYTPALWSREGDGLAPSGRLGVAATDQLITDTLATCALEDLLYETGPLTAHRLLGQAPASVAGPFLGDVERELGIAPLARWIA